MKLFLNKILERTIDFVNRILKKYERKQNKVPLIFLITGISHNKISV